MSIRFTKDDRGVSEVVGAILVFGLLIALMAVMQTQAVPAANQEVEYNHNQDVQSDLVKFQETASRAASQGSTESVRVQMGATYPSRMLFFNPQNPSGQIRTADSGSASIDNVQATDDTVAKYIDGSTDDLETKRIEYRPSYNEYRNSPTTVLEYGVLYNDFGEGRLVQDPGNVVSGNSINLMFFAGDLSRATGGAMSINALPASAPARTVTVKPKDDNQPVTVTIPTRLTVEEWTEILSEEIDDGNVERVVDGSGDTVVIELDPEVNRYTLRTPLIGVGNNVEQPDARYIVGPEGEQGTVPKGSVRDVTFEVRDKYNNPVRGEEVNLYVDGPGDLSETEVTTNEEGQATVRYTAPSNANTPQNVPIKVSFERDPSSSNFDATTNPEDFEYTMTIVELGLPTGDPVTVGTTISDSRCLETDRGGAFGTTLLGSEAAELDIEWEAHTGPNNELTSATVKMIDVGTDRNQTVDSMEYSLDTQDVNKEELTLMDRRKNDDSCHPSKTYAVVVTAETDGNRQNSAEDSISGSDIN